MISSEVQRTLVKSPPELWAELSDPAALARHLGELGEIRITRTEPEQAIEWEADNVSGTVSIKPAGWGTNVRLTVVRGAAEPPEPQPEPEAQLTPEPQPEPAATAAATSADPEPTTPAAPDVAPAAAGAGADPGPAPAEIAHREPTAPPAPAPAPPTRRGFFARLFGRRPRPPADAPAVAAEAHHDPLPAPDDAPEAPDDAFAAHDESLPAHDDAFAAVRRVLAPETVVEAHVFAGTEPAARTPTVAPARTSPPSQPTADISTELMVAEDVAADEVAAEEVTAVLTAVLDRLGAAHHRPFSRA
jgi:hypothetical protein